MNETMDQTICTRQSEAPLGCIEDRCGNAEIFCNRLVCKLSGRSYNLRQAAELDIVNHPPHYESGKFECIDVMRETQGDGAVMDFCICNALKYIYRHRNKNGIEDIRKAKWYIDKYLEIVDGADNE